MSWSVKTISSFMLLSGVIAPDTIVSPWYLLGYTVEDSQVVENPDSLAPVTYRNRFHGACVCAVPLTDKLEHGLIISTFKEGIADVPDTLETFIEKRAQRKAFIVPINHYVEG